MGKREKRKEEGGLEFPLFPMCFATFPSSSLPSLPSPSVPKIGERGENKTKHTKRKLVTACSSLKEKGEDKEEGGTEEVEDGTKTHGNKPGIKAATGRGLGNKSKKKNEQTVSRPGVKEATGRGLGKNNRPDESQSKQHSK